MDIMENVLSRSRERGRRSRSPGKEKRSDSPFSMAMENYNKFRRAEKVLTELATHNFN